MQHTPNESATAFQAGTHARVDLDRYEKNIAVLRNLAGAGKTFMAVLKANAYGHGAVECGMAAVRAGAGYLAVARISEGIQLRRAGIVAPILVLGGPNLAQVKNAVDHRLTLSVGTLEAFEAVQDVARSSTVRPVLHLKIDTGLHRYGALPDLALDIASRCAADERIVLEGVYGHFSSADDVTSDVTDEQISRSEQVIGRIESAGIKFKYIHLPNSAATISGHLGRSNLVRAGIATYGLAPSPEFALPPSVAPVLSLHSVVTRVFELSQGEGVSYGLTYRAPRDEASATIAIGYADGIPRSVSNQGWFLVNGERRPIRGRVSMDQTVIGLAAGANVGYPVVVVGDAADGAMTIDDLARFDNTLNYEVVTRVSARVPRVYYRDGELVGWHDALLGEASET